MPAWLIAAIALAIILAAALLLPARVRLRAELHGAYTRGEARVGLVFGILGVKLCFSAYKNAAGRLEARVWRKGHAEKIRTLPLPNELPGVIYKEIAKKIGEGKEKGENKEKRGKKGGFLSRWLRALIRSARVKTLKLSGTLGTGNAAATALLTGTVSGALQALLAPVLKSPPPVSIAPDYTHEGLNLELECIADVRPGKSTFESIRI